MFVKNPVFEARPEITLDLMKGRKRAQLEKTERGSSKS
jgi:hypothetical protein